MYFFRLLVGAPKANTTQKGVKNPGSVYSCGLTHGDKECQQLLIDTRNENETYNAIIYDEVKEDQRLGSSLATTKDGRVLVSRMSS